MTPWMAALVVTLAIEVPFVAWVYPGQRCRMALVALAANTVTNVTLNVLLARSPGWMGHHLLPGEAFAVVFEAAAYATFARPRDVARAAMASGAANALSFAAGFTAIAAALHR
jgi:hypothetical protein